jgi:zinc transport system substrate-binding protein
MFRGMVLLLFLWTNVTAHAAPLNVFVSILPQKYLAERIGGAHVQVSVLVGPGKSPETYEPTPRQMQALANAQVYFSLGSLAFERTWLTRAQSANPTMLHVRTDKDIVLRTWHEEEGGGHKHDHHAHELHDPHIWTAPLLALRMAATMRDGLQQADPAHQQAYADAYAVLAAELESLDAELSTLLAPLKGSRFMIFHPSLGYFADAYGLRQITIEEQGKEPGPKTLARLVTLAKKENIRVIFVQQQFGRKPAQAVAEAIKAEIIEIDPLAEDYHNNLREIARLLQQAMS